MNNSQNAPDINVGIEPGEAAGRQSVEPDFSSSTLDLEAKEQLDAILAETFSLYGYPDDFLEEFDQLECLSSHRGCETFLCRSRNTGELAVAKCFALAVYDLALDDAIHRDFGIAAIPRLIGEYRNDVYVCIVREYVEGTPLSELVSERELSQAEILRISLELCDILADLHNQEPPVIHRDIKPENVIIDEGGSVHLIDLDIARTFKAGGESDTFFFGTKGYAPPEQYGFKQTDARSDIYSFGVLLRFLLTGNIKENNNVKVNRPLKRVIDKCTAFAPEKRFSDMESVKRALQAAEPQRQNLRKALIAVGVIALCALVVLVGVKLYEQATYSPFGEGHVPAYVEDEEKIAEAVAYMQEKYGTSLFDASDDIATVGFLRQVLMEVYGFDHDYVYGFSPDMPQESDDYFMPWGWDDVQTVDRDVMVYAAVKLNDPAFVADWSSLKDDNGEYPGVRVAMAFAERTGILDNVHRPGDITKGEMAMIIAETDKVFAGR